MQGDAVRALATIARAKGWDPAKIEGGGDVEVGLDRSMTGNRSLSPFPKASMPATEKALTFDQAGYGFDARHPAPGDAIKMDARLTEADWNTAGEPRYQVPPIAKGGKR